MGVVYSTVFGCCSGCWASLFPVILVDLLGVSVIERALGLALASVSIAFLIASPIAGAIYHLTGKLCTPYLVVGAIQASGGLIFFLIKFLKNPIDILQDYESLPGSDHIKNFD